MSWPEWPKNTKIRRPKFAAAAAALAGLIRARPEAAGRKILPAVASRHHPPPWPVREQ